MPCRAARAECVERRQRVGEALAQDLDGEFALGGEVVVEAAVGHAGRFHQPFDAHAVDAAQPKSLAGRGQDLLAVEPLLLPCDAGHVDHLPRTETLPDAGEVYRFR
jgi:hypothetical protein